MSQYTQLYVLATASHAASPKPVMVRCKSATPEWQRHKGTQEQPPGLGWAGLGWAGLGCGERDICRDGIILGYIILGYTTAIVTPSRHAGRV